MKEKCIKPLCFVAFAVLLFSCKKDGEISCTYCSSPQTSNFEVCEEGNGNASVNGQDTGTPFSIYIADLEAAGASCGN